MSGLAVDTTTSAAAEIDKLTPGARVVEALPLFAEVLNAPSQKFGDLMATIYYTGDDAEAKQVIAALLRETNVEVIDAGPLQNTRYVEPAMFLLVQLAYAQKSGQVAFKLL
ncbi:MAG: hypothetical protein ACAF41_01850 [Leptolyngbya sp. BL-A-14]